MKRFTAFVVMICLLASAVGEQFKKDNAEEPVEFISAGPSDLVTQPAQRTNPDLATKFIDLVTGDYGQMANKNARFAKP